MSRVCGFPFVKVVQRDRQELGLKRIELPQHVSTVADRVQDIRMAQEGGDLGIAVRSAQVEQRMHEPGERRLREGLVLRIESRKAEIRQRALQRRDGFAIGNTDGELWPRRSRAGLRLQRFRHRLSDACGLVVGRGLQPQILVVQRDGPARPRIRHGTSPDVERGGLALGRCDEDVHDGAVLGPTRQQLFEQPRGIRHGGHDDALDFRRPRTVTDMGEFGVDRIAQSPRRYLLTVTAFERFHIGPALGLLECVVEISNVRQGEAAVGQFLPQLLKLAGDLQRPCGCSRTLVAGPEKSAELIRFGRFEHSRPSEQTSEARR